MRTHYLFLLTMTVGLLLSACKSQPQKKETLAEQRKIYKSWVVSRCIAIITSTEAEKQDALNSASAYLEISHLPVDSFTNATPLISEFIAKNYQGSIIGTFNTKKRVDLLYSDELEQIFLAEYKTIK